MPWPRWFGHCFLVIVIGFLLQAFRQIVSCRSAVWFDGSDLMGGGTGCDRFGKQLLKFCDRFMERRFQEGPASLGGVPFDKGFR